MLATALAAKLLRRLGHHARAVESFASLLATQEKVLGNDHAEVCAMKSIRLPHIKRTTARCWLTRARAEG
jgi:hypothetical protein